MTDQHVDEAKGRMKEAAGAITDDDSLKNEGKQDRAKAKIKDTVDAAAEKLNDAKEALTGHGRK